MSFDRFFYPEDISYTDKSERIFAKNSLIFNVTEDILVFMEQNDISKNELSKRLGKTKAYVSQMLDGSRNMTIGTFSDICFALGFKPEIVLPIEMELSNRDNYWKVLKDDFLDAPSKKESIKVVENRNSRVISVGFGVWNKQQEVA